MSEPIWCTVKFRTPPKWGLTNPLVDGLGQALINGADDVEGDEWTISGEGNYGLYDTEVEFWLDWMRAHRVPFIATCEAKYEFDGETVVNDGTTEWRGTSGADNALLSKSEFESIKTGTSQFHSVEQFFDILNTSTTQVFSIDHLPETFPYDEDVPEPELVESPDDGLEKLELSSAIDILDGHLVGPRDELLLLARHIHDIIEGEDREHVSG